MLSSFRGIVVSTLVFAAVPLMAASPERSALHNGADRAGLIGVIDPSKESPSQPNVETIEVTLGMAGLIGQSRSLPTVAAGTRAFQVTTADAETYHFLVAGFDAKGQFTTQCVQGENAASEAAKVAAAPTILRLRLHPPVVDAERE